LLFSQSVIHVLIPFFLVEQNPPPFLSCFPLSPPLTRFFFNWSFAKSVCFFSSSLNYSSLDFPHLFFSPHPGPTCSGVLIYVVLDSFTFLPYFIFSPPLLPPLPPFPTFFVFSEPSNRLLLPAFVIFSSQILSSCVLAPTFSLHTCPLIRAFQFLPSFLNLFSYVPFIFLSPRFFRRLFPLFLSPPPRFSHPPYFIAESPLLFFFLFFFCGVV